MQEQRASVSGRLPHHPGAVCGGPVESRVVVSVRLQLTESHRGSVLGGRTRLYGVLSASLFRPEKAACESAPLSGEYDSVRSGIRIGGLISDRGVR